MGKIFSEYFSFLRCADTFFCMKISERIVNALFRMLFPIFFRLNLEALEKIPKSGPMMLILNHPSRYEGPMAYVFLKPRRTIALAKQQLWQRRSVGWLMNMWQAIPVGENGIDRRSMEQCFEVLDQGDFLCIAPEGTRTNDGNLRQGKAGTAYIAWKKQVPVMPLVTVGFEKFSYCIRRLKRTPVHIAVGDPFVVEYEGTRLPAEVRQEIADEMMLRIAQLMPKSYWGYYAEYPLEFTRTRALSESL